MKYFGLMALLLAASGRLVNAQVAAPANEDDVAIRKAIASYTVAFNKADAKALAAHWTETGTFTTPAGKTLQGRALLEKDFAAYFAESKGAKLEIVDPQIRLLSPSVAVETGVARVSIGEEPPSETNYEAIHIKTAGGWRIDSVREEESPAAPPSNYERLKELEWMIGEWVDADDNATVETTCRWTANRNFITRSFKVIVQDRIEMEGTQIIGWDPVAQTIRSWVFDSDGGFGVGKWAKSGTRWTVTSAQVLADGGRMTATNIFEYVDENTCTYRSIGRQLDGELLPNIDPVKIVRKSAE
jgi:uncharacterized protein (TIGR02246 family)